jgi:hypothetical protein
MNSNGAIKTETLERIFIDSGMVVKDYGLSTQTVLGATRGGNVFTVEREYRDMEVDGFRGKVKGYKRIISVAASITANFIELSNAVMLRALPGATTTTTSGPATHDEISAALKIAVSEYMTNLAIVGDVMDKAQPVVCMIENALADGGFELNFTDKDESVLAVTFSAHWDVAKLNGAEPWRIFNPKL